MEEPADLLEQAKAVLKNNQRGNHTIPKGGLYSHQWLWDSCFIAIGLQHYDVERAKKEILNLLRGQWSNGMLPHMIFSVEDEHPRDPKMWRSWLNPAAPNNVQTSGITQPPVLAEAIVRIGAGLKLSERRTWYQTVFPALLAYHNWLYDERDPHGEGLVLQIHPWETGLDNTPPWMSELKEHELPLWIRLMTKKPFVNLVTYFRRDTHYVNPEQRLSTFEGLALYYVQRRLRRKGYDIDRILSHSLFAIEDITFNSIFVRANSLLREIAENIKYELPHPLLDRMKQTEEALDLLWDAYSGQYYSRNFVTHNLIKIPSIGTLLPLYAGSISKERAAQLVSKLRDAKQFQAPYPIPSVPLDSKWFKPHGYWQGPMWVNTNWLIIDGLRRYGYHELADAIAKTTLQAVSKSGFHEYFSPLDGSPAGADNFSWTAALVIDLHQTHIDK